MKKLSKFIAALLCANLPILAVASETGAQPQSVAASNVISGIVTDAAGEPVIGAAVMSADGKIAVITDAGGNFTFGIGSSEVVLEVSCLGYATKTVTVRPSQGNVTIVLEEDAQLLEATVVVGYGSQKKSNLTGALSVVEASELQNRSALDVGHMLQGMVPGLNVTSGSGRPGEAASINIRGLNSLNGGNPLVLIDGVEGDLQRVSASDVESISVIKDAAAAAIYGARASFGVILVTTKSGSDKDGKPTLSYSGRFGFTTPTTRTDYETSGYWSVYINNTFWHTYNGQKYASYSDQDMEELWARRNDVTENPERPWVVITNEGGENVYNYYANTDWYHWAYNDVNPTMSHSLSLSGGSKNFKYFLSGNYVQEQGAFKSDPDIYRKYNLRSKLSLDVTKWLNVTNNTSFFSSTYSYPGISGANSAFGKLALHALASYPTQNPDGTAINKTKYNNYEVGDRVATFMNNPGFKNADKANEISNTVEVTIHPIKQLEIKGNYTYTFYNKQNTNRSVNTSYSTVPGKLITIEDGICEDRLSETASTHSYHAVNVYGTYSDTFADAHNLKVMLGFNYETKHLKDVKAYGYNLMSETLNDLALTGVDDEGNKRTDVGGGQNEYAIAGFFGRINYDYKGKYLFELSGRYDGTSRFSSVNNSRWGFFPSGSVGWKISEENFFKPAKDIMNLLKIRYSYGQLGNQQVGYYDYIRSVSVGKGGILLGGDRPIVASLGDPVASDLTWETAMQHNVGVDMGFFDNRLTFTGEAYIRDTKNMLTDGVALPAVYGAGVPKMNAADLRTMGYELSLNWKDQFKIGKHPFEYNVGFSFSDCISKITKYANPERTLSKKYYVGMTYGEIWGYHIDGLFATDEEAALYTGMVDCSKIGKYIIDGTGLPGFRAGDVRYADLDNSGAIDDGAGTVDKSGDRRIIGNSQPRYNYGINLGFRFYGFDFSLFLQGVGHQDWAPGGEAEYFWGPFCRPYSTLIPKGFLDLCWSEENPNAYFPRPRGYIAMGSRALDTVNDRYLQNIGYCRVKNLTFGYSIPARVLEKAKIKNIRVYFSGENLGYIAKNLFLSDYIDPELAAASSDLKKYRFQKTFMFGIDLTF